MEPLAPNGTEEKSFFFNNCMATETHVETSSESWALILRDCRGFINKLFALYFFITFFERNKSQYNQKLLN